MADQKKEHVSLVVVGTVDSGKSTTTGRLLFDLGGISQREIDKLQAEADAVGKGSFVFAFYTDNNKEERERGITINCNTKEFFTPSKHYTIIDAPGHRDFIKNMISGASQADVAILMAPADKGAFEAAISRGDRDAGLPEGQTRAHARLLFLLGVEQVIVGINKMDENSCNYSEARYNEIRDEMSKMLQNIGFKIKKIPFIPMSGWTGENLTKPSVNMPWYKGWTVNINPKETLSGVTLLDALDKMVQPPQRNRDGNLRVPVSGIYKIKGVGDVITGRVEQGVVKPGDIVGFAPSGITGMKVFSVEMHHKSYPEACPGDNVGLNIKGLSKDAMPKTGDVMYIVKQGELKPVKSFRATVFVQDHPGQLKVGFSPIVHCRTAKSACKMTAIHWKQSKKTGNERVTDPGFIEAMDQAEVTFEPLMPFYLESYEQSPALGRIAIMESNSLCMLGKVIQTQT
jgi:elongation factor 1-alpha